MNRAKVVGQISGVGANMDTWYPINEDSFISISTAAPTLPGTEKSWEGTGVIPDYRVSKENEIAFAIQLINAQK